MALETRQVTVIKSLVMAYVVVHLKYSISKVTARNLERRDHERDNRLPVAALENER